MFRARSFYGLDVHVLPLGFPRAVNDTWIQQWKLFSTGARPCVEEVRGCL